MTKLSRYSVLISGILSPFAALFLYTVVYQTLTERSADLEKDWLFRLSVSTLAMTVPFFVTLGFAIHAHRRRGFGLAGKIGLGVAILSLGLTWKPVNDGILRSKQSRNLAMRDVAAPNFDTPDIVGNPQRLSDQKGKVVLVNIWATWCGPCRAEMPALDQLYRLRQQQGLVVFGISSEDVDTQRKFVQRIPVTYPLLTVSGEVPHLYRDIARYPAIFLIDRRGRLQPAPGPDRPFGEVVAAVDALLNGGS